MAEHRKIDEIHAEIRTPFSDFFPTYFFKPHIWKIFFSSVVSVGLKQPFLDIYSNKEFVSTGDFFPFFGLRRRILRMRVWLECV